MKMSVLSMTAALLVSGSALVLAQSPKGDAPGGPPAAQGGGDMKGGAPGAAPAPGGGANVPRGGDGKADMKAGEKADMKGDKASKSDSPARADKDDGKAGTKTGDTKTGDTKDSKSGEAKGDKAGGSTAVNVTPEQKTKVKAAFSKHKVKSQDVNVNVSVGVAIPRTVTLYAVPEDIVVIVPAYRRYRYFIDDGVIVIVDPDTFVIVDVISA